MAKLKGALNALSRAARCVSCSFESSESAPSSTSPLSCEEGTMESKMRPNANGIVIDVHCEMIRPINPMVRFDSSGRANQQKEIDTKMLKFTVSRAAFVFEESK